MITETKISIAGKDYILKKIYSENKNYIQLINAEEFDKNNYLENEFEIPNLKNNNKNDLSVSEILINGEVFDISYILKSNNNLIQLRDLEKDGFIIRYDTNKGIPSIETSKI